MEKTRGGICNFFYILFKSIEPKTNYEDVEIGTLLKLSAPNMSMINAELLNIKMSRFDLIWKIMDLETREIKEIFPSNHKIYIEEVNTNFWFSNQGIIVGLWEVRGRDLSKKHSFTFLMTLWILFISIFVFFFFFIWGSIFGWFVCKWESSFNSIKRKKVSKMDASHKINQSHTKPKLY